MSDFIKYNQTFFADPRRAQSLADRFHARFATVPLRFFSAPGRAEIGGNHTDHQRGRVLAAAIDLDVLCAASPNDLGLIRLDSMGYHVVSTDDLAPRSDEKNTTPALIRGIAARFAELGYRVSGFDACLSSNVLVGSGLSSSAAFEVAVATMINHLFNDGQIPPGVIARICQYAENTYFGKPSGLMDQMTSATGGLVMIDFKDPERPEIERVDFDFAHSAHALCVTGPLGSHSDLTDAYSAITSEMRVIASYFGEAVLREVDPDAFYAALPQLRGKVPDRAILRAAHFFSEHSRVLSQARALREGNFNEFLRLTDESGRSSFQYLQNVCHGDDMILALALSASERILGGSGACRVHGGGFAGTILAFVPLAILDIYVNEMNRLFGSGSCHTLDVRGLGACEVEVRL